ncbi:MAG: S1 RNA-binding domain-containing protein [Oscillospiraceae bacterium]|jgi:small subunit ribosomal protein S1|nr:S1 RNA-binding domain-containing protein [Oscillospiraceae bacterium]
MTGFFNGSISVPPKPEGELFCTEENKLHTSSKKTLEECITANRTVEAPCIVCDSRHNLIIDFGFMKGMIPRAEGALGIEEGITRDIALISRVNKPVCFKVTGFAEDSFGRETVMLSRKAAQLECMEHYVSALKTGDVINVKVTHLEQFGAFVDIGCGLPSLIPIDAISVSRISHPADRFFIGQKIFAVVKAIENNGSVPGGKITLSHKELLGTWAENAAKFTVGETVVGIIRSVENYGIFVELAPNLAGLAELRENVKINQQASVYIKAIIPEKMKIKLIIVDICDYSCINHTYDYFIDSGHVNKWVYSTQESEKLIFSDFN